MSHKFKIPKGQQLFIDAWRACSEIISSVDMDDHRDITNNDDQLITTIDQCTEQMEEMANEMERDQKMILETLQVACDKREPIED